MGTGSGPQHPAKAIRPPITNAFFDPKAARRSTARTSEPLRRGNDGRPRRRAQRRGVQRQPRCRCSGPAARSMPPRRRPHPCQGPMAGTGPPPSALGDSLRTIRRTSPRAAALTATPPCAGVQSFDRHRNRILRTQTSFTWRVLRVAWHFMPVWIRICGRQISRSVRPEQSPTARAGPAASHAGAHDPHAAPGFATIGHRR